MNSVLSHGAAHRNVLYAAIAAACAARTFEGDKLPATTNSLDNVPEAFRGFYEQVGENYVLSVDDSPFKAKLKEFRENNIDLLKKKEELENKLSGLKDVDPEEYHTLKKKMQELEDQSLIDEGKIDELLTTRTERMRKDFESQTTTLQKRLQEMEQSASSYKEKLEKVMIDSHISNAVSAVGTVRQNALPDVLSRARNTWRLDETGNPIAVNQDGSKRYGKDGSKPLTMDEWAADLLTEAPFLFETSEGGGSNNRDRNRDNNNAGMIQKSDRRAFSGRLEDIAKGKVRVAG